MMEYDESIFAFQVYDPAAQANAKKPNTNELSQVCVILDLKKVTEAAEVFMSSESIVYCRPKTFALDEARNITGNLHALTSIFSDIQHTDIRRSSTPELFTFRLFKVSVITLYDYFVILTGPPDMSGSCLTQQLQLFAESLKFFLGPLSSLHVQYSEEETVNLVRKVAHFISNFVMPDRGVIFRNNVGYLPTKANVPVYCLLRSSTLIDSLNLFGGLVVYKKKIVFSNLPNSLVSILHDIEERNVPIEPIPNADNFTILRVFLTATMWGTLSSCSSGPNTTSPNTTSPKTLDLFLEDLDKCTMTSYDLGGGSDDVSDNFELVPGDLPEDVGEHSEGSFMSSSISRGGRNFSLLSELFDNKPELLNKRGSKTRSVEADMFHDSVESQLSGSELPGNSLNYKLNNDVMFHPPSLQTETDKHSSGEEIAATSDISATPEPLPDKIPELPPVDVGSVGSSYHDALSSVHHGSDPIVPDSEQFPADSEDFKDCEMTILSRCDTTIVLLGDNLIDRASSIWAECLQLLGDVNACFNIENRSCKQKATAHVNSFVFNKENKSLLYSHASKGTSAATSASHNQIKFCKNTCDEEGEVDLICVKNASCSTVMKSTSSADIYLTSNSFPYEKLADKVVDITNKNFDAVFL